MSSFSFADPWFFLLLGVPALVFLLAPSASAFGASLRVPEGVGRHIRSEMQPGRRILLLRYGAQFTIWVLMVVALAGPRQIAPVEALPVSGRDLILALDLSGSMVREDFFLDGKAITRLDAVRDVGSAFVRGRGGDRVGLVVFGSEAYVAAPLSFDVHAVAHAVASMVIGISGRATNVGDAIGLALKRLDGSDAEAKVIVLLSDGESNAGATSPPDVAKLAREMDVRIHTIAFGPKELSTTPQERGVVDTEALKAVARLSRGEMFRVRTTEDLRRVAEAINQLEPTVRAGLAAETHRDLWIFPVILAGLGCLWFGWRAPA